MNTIVVKSTLLETKRLGGWISQLCKERGIRPPEVVFALQVAIEEMTVNIVQHGYRSESGDISISLGFCPGEVVVVIEDVAPAYDPLQTPTPDLTLPVDQREPGGLGVHLVRQLMDVVEYRHIHGKNVVTLRKRVMCD